MWTWTLTLSTCYHVHAVVLVGSDSRTFKVTGRQCANRYWIPDVTRVEGELWWRKRSVFGLWPRAAPLPPLPIALPDFLANFQDKFVCATIRMHCRWQEGAFPVGRIGNSNRRHQATAWWVVLTASIHRQVLWYCDQYIDRYWRLATVATACLFVCSRLRPGSLQVTGDPSSPAASRTLAMLRAPKRTTSRVTKCLHSRRSKIDSSDDLLCSPHPVRAVWRTS